MESRRLAEVTVIIPALDEEASLPLVLRDLPRGLDVVVVDNGSADATAEVAMRGGARVVREPRRGYGFACLAGLAALSEDTRVVAFLDADYSDFPDELPLLVDPIREGRADLVIGSRMLGARERGALPAHSLFGNWLASTLMRRLYGLRVTDVGPFRAIRRDALERLAMQPAGFCWTAEMMVKAARAGLRVVERPVRYRRRLGRSKITGTLLGSLRAAWGILSTVFLYLRWRPDD